MDKNINELNNKFIKLSNLILILKQLKPFNEYDEKKN